MIIRNRPLKERINITVDPTVHEQFSQLVERQDYSVSAVLNDLMAVYCGGEDDEPFQDRPRVTQRLRHVLMANESGALQQIVLSVAHACGLENFGDVERANDEPPDPSEFITEWTGMLSKMKTGVRLALSLSYEPDIALGQALLFRGASRCERVILVVPCRLGIPQNVLQATEHAGLEVVGVDALESALRRRRRGGGTLSEASEQQSESAKHS